MRRELSVNYQSVALLIVATMLALPATAMADVRKVPKATLYKRMVYWGNKMNMRGVKHWAKHGIKTGWIESRYNAHAYNGYHRGWLQMEPKWGTKRQLENYDYVARRYMKSVKEHGYSHSKLRVHWKSIR